MKVSELIEKLQELDPELKIYLSKDEEGNGFSTLVDVEESFFYTDDYESRPIHPDDLPEYDDYKLFKAVVLWP